MMFLSADEEKDAKLTVGSLGCAYILLAEAYASVTKQNSSDVCDDFLVEGAAMYGSMVEEDAVALIKSKLEIFA